MPFYVITLSSRFKARKENTKAINSRKIPPEQPTHFCS